MTPTHHPKQHPHHKKVPLISIEMASKTYGDDPLDFKNLVLRNIYLQIFQGEFVIVFGPSGSGKSTLLNLIAGLEHPTGGRVLVRRRDLTKFDSDELAQFHRRKMGFVFQNFNLIKSLNVWENVALPQTASGVPMAERKRKAMRLLKLLRLEDYANRHPNELSGGEQQRVAIARALVNDPFFLLVDEPTGNLDTKSAEGVMEILHNIHTNDKHTIILVTHNPNQLKYATRVIYMEDGQIVIEESRDQKGDVATPSHIVRQTTTPNAHPLVPAVSAQPNTIAQTSTVSTEPAKTAPAPPVSTKKKSAKPTAAPMKGETPTVAEPILEAKSSATPKPEPAVPNAVSAPPTTPASSEAPAPPAPTEFVNDDVVKTVIIKGEGDK